MSVGLLVSCSSKQNFDYLKSHNGAKIVVKAPLSSDAIDTTYELKSVGKIKAQNIEPPMT